MPKRIILLLDGTWNDADFGDSDTNIVRIRDLIAKTLWAGNDAGVSPLQSAAARPSPDHDPVTPKKYENLDNIVFYERGVGTRAFLDRFSGGALGKGLTANIRRAYKFLSFHYEPGDQIFLFGFSRGAFTARSIVGYIHAAGLLKREHCTPELEEKAWGFYRTPPNDRSPGIWTDLAPHTHDRSKFRIACLGVFDTVGALGIPLRQFKVRNRDTTEFHDVGLCSITDVNLHALAIDEQRHPFQPSIWRRSKFKHFDTVVEQVWFPGVHADVGGGYFNERKHSQLSKRLDNLTLDWMLKRVKHHFKDFPVPDKGWPPILDSEKVTEAALSAQHQSRKKVYRVWPRALRSLNNKPVECRHIPLFGAFSEVNVGHDRHERASGEMIHISLLLRWNKKVVGWWKRAYRPKNLRAALTAVASTYGGGEDYLPIVDWDGKPLDPAIPEHKVAALRHIDALGLKGVGSLK